VSCWVPLRNPGLSQTAVTFTCVCIQGNCTSKPSFLALGLPAETFEGLKGNQCILVFDETLIEVGTNLLLHNLYLRHTAWSTYEDDFEQSSLVCSHECKLWLTSVTLQGEEVTAWGTAWSRALIVQYGDLFASGAQAVFAQVARTFRPSALS
jgi:hypothetical protein